MNFPLELRHTWTSAILGAALSLSLATRSHAQSILNGTFSSNTTGWTTCGVEVGISLLYGGGSLSNRVASVNAGLLPSNDADDKQLCQTINGFTVGSIYALSFNATRGQILGTPSTVVSYVTLGSSLETVVSRSGGWNMTQSQFTFTATQTTYDLVITPGQEGILGMIFDDIAITLVSSLPVELLYFKANSTEDGVRLSWATATENNNHHFTVERSTDGNSFDLLTELPGAGNSQHVLEYSTMDQAPLHGISYYRLKQSDMDGTVTYSAVVSIDHRSNGPRLICAPDHFVVLGDATGHTLNLLSARGELVHSIAVRGSRVERPALAPGMYIVALTDPRSGANVLGRVVQD